MKLFKKKSVSDSAPAPEKTSAPDKTNALQEAGGFQRFSTYQYGMLLVVLIIFGVSALLQDRMVLSTSEQNALHQLGDRSAASLSSAFNYQVRHFQTQVSGIANSPIVLAALSNPSEFNARQPVSTMLPYLENAYLFAKGGITLRLSDGQQLSFASLDMLKRAEKGENVLPEAYLLEDKWHIQVAAPVNDDSGVLAGTLLLIFDARLMKDIFSGVNGEVTVIQVVEGKEVPFATVGSGEGDAYVLNSSTVPHWKVKYRLPPMGNLMDRTFFWSVMAISALLGCLGIFLVMTVMMNKIRHDVVVITEYAQKLLSGEIRRVPALIFGHFDAMARSLERTARERRKAAPASEKTSEISKARGSHGSTSAARDTLDVAVQAEDERLLGMGADKPSGGAPDKAPAQALTESDDFLEDDSLDLSLDEALLEGADATSYASGLFDGNEDDGGLMADSLLEEDGLEIAEVEMIDVPESVFCAYDVRGVVGEALTPELAVHLGRAVAAQARKEGLGKLAVGHDGRSQSRILADNLVQGLVAGGMDVADLACVPAPLLYFAVEQKRVDGGVMVTGGHNPAGHSGFKIVLGDRMLAGDELEALRQRMLVQDYTQGQGTVQPLDVRGEYTEAILNDIAIAAPLRVVVDASHGAASEIAPQLLEDLGCEVIPLNCEVDEAFPDHEPDPGNPDNLRHLIETVQQEAADLGIAFDGSGGRIGVVTNEGKVVWPDRLLMLFAKDVVSRNPGSDIIFDVKCSRRLNALVSEYGGRPIMWKTGAPYIRAKMKEASAALAGEFSGHIFFKERWFGFEDAIYAATRLLEILGLDDRSAEEVFSALPEDVATPELLIPVAEGEQYRIVDLLRQSKAFADGNVSDLDGVRVDYSDGWGLCRASNSRAALVLRFEANDQGALDRIRALFGQELLKIDENLTIPG